MPVLINFKICDNAPECNGAAVCKTGAISWDVFKKTLVVNNLLCVSCGACAPVCMVGAIKVAKTQKGFERIKKEYVKDRRKISDLFIDRYGAQPLHKGFELDEGRFDVEILNYPRVAVVELFNAESIICLYCSIPIKDLFPKKNLRYRKVALKSDALIKKYGVSKLPTLLFFNRGKLLGKIEGIFKPEEVKELKNKINKLIK